MVMAVVYNKDGMAHHFSKPCFGFLSYIQTWDDGEGADDDDDNWDDDDYEEYEEGPLDGFESTNLSHLIWTPGVNFMQSKEGQDYNSDDRIFSLLPAIFEAFPQYFEGFSVIKESSDDNLSIKVPLAGQNMQTVVLGCMMLRNVLEYTHFRSTFDHLINKGTPLKVAFILGCSMVGIFNMSYKGNMYYWSTGGDDQIFGDDARIIDFKNMVEGGVGTIYQGEFGDTENGYGRYGYYGNKSSGKSLRSGNPLSLTDTPLVSVNADSEAAIAASQSLNSLMMEVDKTARFSEDKFGEFTKRFCEEVLGD